MSDLEIDPILDRLAGNRFRSKFKLNTKERNYIRDRGMSVIESHANEFVESRLKPSEPRNDGEQTPFRGHPVFVAQHATATCCRTCIQKWHSVPKGVPLEARHLTFIVRLILGWITRQLGTKENDAEEQKKSVDIKAIENQSYLFDID